MAGRSFVGWVERSDTHQRRCVWRWVSLRSTHPTRIRLRVLAAHSPEVCMIISRPLRNQRAQGRPGACCTRGLACDLRKQNCTRAYRAAGAFRPSLRNGFTAYFVLSPVNGFLATVAPRSFASQDLAPAPRRQDHTTSPYAQAAHVSRSSRVHRISPHVRDDGQRPSSAVRRAELWD